MRRHWLALRRWFLRSFVADWYWPDDVEVDGARIRLRGTPYSFGTRQRICSGRYEAPERALIARHIQPGMQVIELGGSIGVVTAVLAHRVGPGGRVVSVEASAKLTAFSRTWLEGDGRTTVLTGYAFPTWRLPADLRVHGFREDAVPLLGRVAFDVDTGDGPSADHAAAGPAPASHATRPPTYDLETICREAGMQAPEALVVDIEAGEEVLCHAPADLPPSVKTIIVELHPALYRGGPAAGRDILAALEREGFCLADHLAETHLLTRP